MWSLWKQSLRSVRGLTGDLSLWYVTKKLNTQLAKKHPTEQMLHIYGCHQ